jgi:hypothetical protein
MKFKEDDLQMAVARYLDYSNYLWFHVANERKASNVAGVRLKKKGVKSGVPDIMIFEPNEKYSGLAIELKIKPNKTTPNQDKWLEDLNKKGWSTHVCYSLDEVIKTLEYHTGTGLKNN